MTEMTVFYLLLAFGVAIYKRVTGTDLPPGGEDLFFDFLGVAIMWFGVTTLGRAMGIYPKPRR